MSAPHFAGVNDALLSAVRETVEAVIEKHMQDIYARIDAKVEEHLAALDKGPLARLADKFRRGEA